MGRSSELVWGVGGKRFLQLRNAKGPRSEKGGKSQTLWQRHPLVREAVRGIVQLEESREVGIGVGDGAGSESGSACAGTVDDDFETLGNGAAKLESAMIREKLTTVFDCGWILDGVWAVTRSEHQNCADVLVCIPLFYPHDALEKVKTFDCDAQIFSHHLSNPDVGVWGLDFRRKAVDLYVADSHWDFLSDTIRAELSWVYDTRFLNPLCDLAFLRLGVRVSGRT